MTERTPAGLNSADPAGTPTPAEMEAIETVAIEAARAGGELVSGRFGGAMDVESKDGNGANPVTDVDRASQALIAGIIARHYPGHVVIGEEDAPKPEDEPPAADFVWCVDPIDGTTNFVNGHPVYAVSVGVLYRGAPVAAAIWLPWPTDGGHVVMHARKGGGAWIGDRRLAVKRPGDGEEPKPRRGWLSTLPGGLGYMYNVRRGMRGNFGEPRTTGSAVYELAMVATGVLQYALTGVVFSWDIAAGTLMVTEAGGTVLTPAGPDDKLVGDWAQFESFAPNYDNSPETTARIRRRRRALLAGSPDVVWFVSRHLRPRRRGFWKRLGRLFG